MNPVCVDIKAMLTTGGITRIYLGSEPRDVAKPVTVIYDTGGEAPDPKWLIDYPTFQIRSVGADYQTGYGNLLAIRDILLGRAPGTVNNTHYGGIWANTDIIFLGMDGKNNYTFVCNFRTMREPSSGGNRTGL